jgi:hypothetical protein
VTLRFYVGKRTVENVSPLYIIGDILLQLVDGLPEGQNYEVFMDSWFRSFSLLCAFKEIGILALRTARIWRLLGCSLKTDRGWRKSG